MSKRSCPVLLTGLLLALTAAADDLVVAHVGPFSGPLGPNGTANLEGGKACIAEANAAGGVHGRKLRLVPKDDKYQPAETVRLVREVAERDHPIAFISLLGSANVGALLKAKVMEDVKIPVVGITPGADVVRTGNPWMFHVHASDNAQIRRILQHLSTIGISRIAVVYQDLPFGRGGLQYTEELAPGLKLGITGRVPVPAGAEDLKAAAAELRRSGAQAYVMVLAPNSGMALVRDARGGGDTTPIYGMSYVPVAGLVEKAGLAHAVGIGLAQTTPNTYSSSTGLVRSFRAAMGKYAPPGTGQSQLHLIGYLNCRVLLEGLAAAGSNPTPERVRAGLAKVRTDLGGYPIDFGQGTVASRYVDIGVVTREGKLAY